MVLINILMYWSDVSGIYLCLKMPPCKAFQPSAWLDDFPSLVVSTRFKSAVISGEKCERCEGVWRCRVTGVQSVPLRLRHSEDNKYHVVTSVRVWAGAGAGGAKSIYDHRGLRKQLVVLLKKSWSGSEVFWEVLMLLKIVTLVLFHRREDWREVGLVQSVIDSQRVIYSTNGSTFCIHEDNIMNEMIYCIFSILQTNRNSPSMRPAVGEWWEPADTTHRPPSFYSIPALRDSGNIF